jgi:hypothetical protein
MVANNHIKVATTRTISSLPTENRRKPMKPIAFAAVSGAVLLLVSNLTLADYDPREEAASKAFQQQKQEKARKDALAQQEGEARNTKARADMARHALGAEANGKSDAEVITMLEERGEALEKQYGPLLQQAEKNQGTPMSDEQADQALNEALRNASGDESMNMEDLENMSDAELEALAAKAAAQEQ